MKVKHVLKDLGPKTLVQIYKPSSVSSGYVEGFLKAYPAEEINYMDYSWVKSVLEKEIDHVEYGHYYTTNDMVASCNIYLKAKNAANEEKPSTSEIDYADLKRKWKQFCKEYCVEGADIIHAWHINVFLNMLENGELVEMEDKDLS